MKKVIYLGCIFLYTIVTAEVTMSVSAGYSTVSMKKVNDELKRMVNVFSSTLPPGFTISSKTDELASAVVLNLNGTYRVASNLKILAGIEYLMPNEGKLEFKASSNIGGYDVKFEIYETISVPLITPYVGVGYTTSINETLFLGGVLNVGYGLSDGVVKIKAVMQEPGQSANESEKKIEISGGGVAVQINSIIKYFLSKNISLFANLGYRYASIPEVRAKKDVDMNDDGVISEDDIEKGEPMKDLEDKAVPFDYSGLVFNIGFGIKF